MNTILIGVDASAGSEDAVAFARRLAAASPARCVVLSAFPYDDHPSRAADLGYREALRADAEQTARRLSAGLEIPGDRIEIRVAAQTSPAHALHDFAEREPVSLIVVGSTHTGRLGRVIPGSTGERLLHGAPCPVAVVPHGYRTLPDRPLERIGAAYIGSSESRAAVSAAAEVARATGARLEVITVFAADEYGTPALMGGPGYNALRQDIEGHMSESLAAVIATLPSDVAAEGLLLASDPASALAEHSAQLDLLVVGSRGYGPLRAVLAGGVSGRVLRTAQCPVIAVPRGVEAPLGDVFGATAAAAA